jgi:hypothetical protein
MHRDDAMRILTKRFGHSQSLAGKAFDDYIVCMDERLTVDFGQFERLLSQVAPKTPGGARQVAAQWIVPGALRG